jgi:Family of unknown function (DUF6152)
MRLRAIGLSGVALVLSMTSASAHHSFAMFDYMKSVTLEGTVKEFQWTNPHSWILMMVRNPQGVEEQWSIELGTPAGLSHQGWVPKTVTPGMKISALIHPLKDGTRGGRGISITLPDGVMKSHPYPLGVRTS